MKNKNKVTPNSIQFSFPFPENTGSLLYFVNDRVNTFLFKEFFPNRKKRKRMVHMNRLFLRLQIVSNIHDKLVLYISHGIFGGLLEISAKSRIAVLRKFEKVLRTEGILLSFYSFYHPRVSNRNPRVPDGFSSYARSYRIVFMLKASKNGKRIQLSDLMTKEFRLKVIKRIEKNY